MRAILVAHRLLAASHVDDGQAGMRQANRAVNHVAATVRATVGEDVAHAQQSCRINCNAWVVVENAGDAAAWLLRVVYRCAEMVVDDQRET